MEVALRRRLEGVAGISISQARQRAEVTFGPGPHAFSPRAFREAVAEADVEVLRFVVDACGTVGQDGDGQWLQAGADRFVLANAGYAAGEHRCLTAQLDDAAGILTPAEPRP
jgi:hypothetical protein